MTNLPWVMLFVSLVFDFMVFLILAFLAKHVLAWRGMERRIVEEIDAGVEDVLAGFWLARNEDEDDDDDQEEFDLE